jgi:hypothetical protein
MGHTGCASVDRSHAQTEEERMFESAEAVWGVDCRAQQPIVAGQATLRER